MKYKYKPTGNKVLIQVETLELKSKGGMYLPIENLDRKQSAHEVGTVIDIGPNAWLELDGSPQAKIGDKVLFVRYAGLEIRETANEIATHRIMNDEDILAVITE